MRSGEFLKAVLVAVVAVALAACTRSEHVPVPVPAAKAPAAKPVVAAPAPDKAVVEARMQQCRATLEAAIEPGLLTNASFDNGRPILWTGPAWKQATPAIRHALARDAACFFRSGDESQTMRYSVYDNATDREIAIWDHTHLLIL